MLLLRFGTPELTKLLIEEMVELGISPDTDTFIYALMAAGKYMLNSRHIVFSNSFYHTEARLRPKYRFLGHSTIEYIKTVPWYITLTVLKYPESRWLGGLGIVRSYSIMIHG